MIQRVISSETRTITGAALILGAASFLSRIVGVIRDHILANQFGAGRELDIYTTAFRLPDFIYTLLILGALSAGFIPIFLDLYKKEKKEAWKFTSQIFNLTIFFICVICIVLYFFTPHIISLLVPGFSPAEKLATIELTRIMLLSPLFLGVSAIVSGVLQSLRSFFVYSLAPIFYNLGIILGAIGFVPLYGLKGLGYGVILGAFFHLLIQLPLLFKKGFHYIPSFSFRDKPVRKLFKLMVPRTITLASTQFTTLIITSFASVLGAGSIAMFNFSNNISSLPIGIIGVSFALAAFPTLSEYANDNDMQNFKKQLSLTTIQILFFIIPFTILFFLLRAQIVRVLLGSGNFNWQDTIITANAMGMLSLGLFSESLNALFSRAFYARHNTRTPLLIAVGSMISIIIISFSLKKYFGVPGLALGISIGSILEIIFLWIFLKKQIGTFTDSIFRESILKIILAGLCMGVATQFLKYPLASVLDMNTFFGIFFQGLFCGLGGILIYILLCFFLEVEEMKVLSESFRKKWLKLKEIPQEEPTLK